MATRSSGKPKQTSTARTRAKSAAEEGVSTAVADATSGKSAAKTTRTARKSRAASASKPQASPSADQLLDQSTNAIALLIEQNEALKAELQQAKERISHLEEVHKNVSERIDWVIDSLQGVLAPKR